jgi:hypothetical protein
LPSRAEGVNARRTTAAALALACAFVSPTAAPAEPASPAAAASAALPVRRHVDVAAVETAASAVRADPDLGGVHKERTWRLKPKKRDPDDRQSSDSFWLDLARWLAEGGRGLLWLLGAAAVAVVLVSARRWLAVHGEAIGSRGARLPSHVRELDIRPESLPADIAAAVRKLWLADERRAALSLLYRGTLSRLVHSYQIAIGDASTEGDCVRLARAALAPERGDFVATLVGAWQLAVYGDRQLPSGDVLRLCDELDRMLPVVASAAPVAEGR